MAGTVKTNRLRIARLLAFRPLIGRSEALLEHLCELAAKMRVGKN
jgi:hypothetical protein